MAPGPQGTHVLTEGLTPAETPKLSKWGKREQNTFTHFRRAGSHSWHQPGALGQSLPWHQGSKDQQDFFSSPLQMKSENVINVPKASKTTYRREITSPDEQESQAPQRGQSPRAPSDKGVSETVPRRKAKGSSLTNESKTRSSTPSGDVRREAAPLLTGPEELQTLSAFRESAQKNQKLAKKPHRKVFPLNLRGNRWAPMAATDNRTTGASAGGRAQPHCVPCTHCVPCAHGMLCS